MWLKNKNTKTKNKNTKFVRLTWKWIFYYVNICKHEYENNMTRLWCKIVLKIDVKQTEGNERSYYILYPFGDLIQIKF
jgi:hypothetical protein